VPVFRPVFRGDLLGSSKLPTLPLLKRVGLVVVLVFATMVIPGPAASACQIGVNRANNHTQGSVPHGWSRAWSCDHYNYNGWTNHGHGTKYVALVASPTGNILCDAVATGSTNASCRRNSGSTHIGSFHDTGPATGGCDLFNDGHGICPHTMEPIP
jgi:hypothetical protein